MSKFVVIGQQIENPHVVSLEQDGQDVNIMVDGLVVMWINPDGVFYLGHIPDTLGLKREDDGQAVIVR